MELFKFIPQSLSPRENTALPNGRMLFGSQNLSGRVWMKTKFLAISGLKTPYHPAPSLVATPTVVFLLPSPIHVNIILRLRVFGIRYLNFFKKETALQKLPLVVIYP
jgi:hypothetical protein